MKDLIIAVLLMLVAVQAIFIALLTRKVVRTDIVRKEEKRVSDMMLKSVIKIAVEERAERTVYEEGYNACYSAYKTLFKESKQKDLRIQELRESFYMLNDTYNLVCSNVLELIRTGRVIKSKNFGKVTTVEFNELTKQDIIDLFGQQII